MYYYCERTTDSFLSEPLNSITNLAFLIVAIFIYKKYRDQIYVNVFSFSIFFIGIGSFLFHLKPNLITLYSDIIPIFLFSLSFIFLFNRNVIKISNLNSALLFILFLTLLLFITPKLKYEILNGSEFYFANYFF